VSYLFLGNEGGRKNGVDDENINPRNMVGNQQGARQVMAFFNGQLETQRMQ